MARISRAPFAGGRALIIRFRNAVKETRDVGFIFFTMAIGMAVGTKFYLLAVIAAVVISLVIMLMTRLTGSPARCSARFCASRCPTMRPSTRSSTGFRQVYQLFRADQCGFGSQRHVDGADLQHRPEEGRQIQEFFAEIRHLNGHNRVTLTAGYNGTDL